MNRSQMVTKAREAANWILDTADSVPMGEISPDGVKWSYHFTGVLIALCYSLTGREGMGIADAEITRDMWYRVSRARLDLQNTLWRGQDD